MPVADRGAGCDGVMGAPQAPGRHDPGSLREADEAPPPRIIHSRDLAAAAEGEAPEYDYNFLDYMFAAGVGARLYLDEPGAVHVRLTRSALAGPAMAPVLVYLQRRFDVIRCLEADGYVEGWRAY